MMTIGYTQRPDRKGTESAFQVAFYQLSDKAVTLKDPIERGLKAYYHYFALLTTRICYTQRPDRKGTERPPLLTVYIPFGYVTLKDPIERGLKVLIFIAQSS